MPAKRLSVKIAIRFTAFQKIGFVGLDNALKLRGAPAYPRTDAANEMLWKPLNFNVLRTPGSSAHRQGILHRCATLPFCEHPVKLCRLLHCRSSCTPYIDSVVACVAPAPYPKKTLQACRSADTDGSQPPSPLLPPAKRPLRFPPATHIALAVSAPS